MIAATTVSDHIIVGMPTDDIIELMMKITRLWDGGSPEAQDHDAALYNKLEEELIKRDEIT